LAFRPVTVNEGTVQTRRPTGDRSSLEGMAALLSSLSTLQPSVKVDCRFRTRKLSSDGKSRDCAHTSKSSVNCVRTAVTVARQDCVKKSPDHAHNTRRSSQDTIGLNSRRGALSAGVLSLLFAPTAAEAAGNPIGPQRNTAILEALKERDQKKEIENGEVIERLKKARDQLSRATTLANAGELSSARDLLRGGAVGSIRDDLKKMRTYLAYNRPSFERFEELSLIGALEAFDNAMRAVQRNSKEVSAEDQARRGNADEGHGRCY